MKKILDFLNTAIDFAQKFMWIIAIVGGLTSIVSIKSCSEQQDQKQNTIAMIKDNVVKFKTKSEKNAIEANNWKIKYKALEKFNGEIKQENSYLKNELIEAKQTIEDLNIKAKNVQNYIKMELVSKDSINTKIIYEDKPCRFKIEPIETEHLSVIFEQSQDYEIMGLNHEYRTDIKTLITLYKDPEQFFLWRWIKPKYKDKTVTIVEDNKATINNFVEITFN